MQSPEFSAIIIVYTLQYLLNMIACEQALEEWNMALGKILVADDDRNIAELLRLYLE